MRPRQSVAGTLPEHWSSMGCFKDHPANRTLSGMSKYDPSMTVELCFAFCFPLYRYAGVEFGTECYCDSYVHLSGGQTNIDECSMSCAGNNLENCGAANRMNLFWNNLPLPNTPDYIGGSRWKSLGCYGDDVNARTLSRRTATSGTVTPASCANACRDSNYVYMGLENGDECWCGNTISYTRYKNDCTTICKYDPTTFCGAADGLNIYYHIAGPLGRYDITCLPPSYSNFLLVAVYQEPPISGPKTYNLKVVELLTTPGIAWSILSACTKCPTLWRTFSFADGGILKPSMEATFPFPRPLIGYTVSHGESPLFIAQENLPADSSNHADYCEVKNPQGSGQNVLQVESRPYLWALCPNTTADGRLDVVFEPRIGHPHYDRRDCGAVDILVYKYFG